MAEPREDLPYPILGGEGGGGDQGATATPSGSQASPEAPSDLRPAGVDPSRTGLRHYPKRVGIGGQLGIVDRQFDFVRCVLNYDYRYTCNAQQWHEARLICEALEGPMASLGVVRVAPAPCDGSGEADETEGLSPQGDSAVTEGQAPDPSPPPPPEGLPEEIIEAIKALQISTKALATGFSNPGHVRRVRSALDTTILRHLHEDERLRDLKAGYARARAERDAARARAERAEKALEAAAYLASRYRDCWLGKPVRDLPEAESWAASTRAALPPPPRSPECPQMQQESDGAAMTS